MQYQATKFNKMTLIKAAASLIVIVIVLVVSAVSVWFAAKNAAYNAALGAYESWGQSLSADVSSRLDENAQFGDSVSEERAQEIFANGYGGFEGVALFSGSYRIVYSTGGISVGTYSYDNGITMPDGDQPVVEVVKMDGKDYAFVTVCVNKNCYLGGFIDFTASAQSMATLKNVITVVSIVSAVVIACAFIAYVVLTGLNERGHRYQYRLVTDIEGRILKSNAQFKQDFPQTLRFYDNVARFETNTLNAIKLPSFDEEVFIACVANKQTNGKIKLSAGTLNMPYNAQATKPRDVMREAYISFLPHGKPFLIGTIFFADLHNIKDMFGREFAETIHDILYNKIAQHFTYIYNLDLYNVGVLCPDGKNYEILMQDLRDIVNEFNRPIKIDDNVVTSTVKCGFAICDNSMERRSFEYAMTAAEAALKRAVEDKLRNYYTFHGTEIKNYAKYFVNYDIRQMLANDMFEMEYQPQYGIKENRIVGFEALFRVKKSAHMQVNIFELIQYAERSGNMVLLGDFIFDTSMRFAKRVEDKGVTVSINVSPIQLMQAGFIDNFLEIYNRYGIKSGVVCVEITESFLVQNFDDAIQKLDILRQNGIEIHLDDFGTRYSSLLYLKKLPCSVIKIDREFVIEVNKDGIDRAIIEMIINICKTQGFQSISEGVETKEQFDTLKKLGVDIIQGYLIGRSMPADAAMKMIDEFRL